MKPEWLLYAEHVRKEIERLKKNRSQFASGAATGSERFLVLARLSEGACPKWPVTACPAVASERRGKRKRSQNPKDPLPPNGYSFLENALDKMPARKSGKNVERHLLSTWRHACDEKKYPGSLADWKILMQHLGSG